MPEKLGLTATPRDYLRHADHTHNSATDQRFCKTFLENALRDPVSGEIGKSIVFAVSQNHACKLAHNP